MYRRDQHLHFVGIGGVGMAGIAEILLDLGYSVSGSDVKKSVLTEHLREMGAEVFMGHRAENLPVATTALISSSAIRVDNPELLEAIRRNVPTIPRAEMLAELMRMKYGIAVAGSHGKTTTTSLIARVLCEGGLDPSVIIGGRVLTSKTGAVLGKGSYLVAEADESDGSFGLLRPAISIVTNIDCEHLGHYGSFGALEDAFQKFMASVPFYGLVVACFDDPVVARLCGTLKRRVISYGMSPDFDLSASEITFEGPCTNFTLLQDGTAVERICLPIPGWHMVQNAMAAIATGVELGLEFPVIKRALESFPGVARRSEVLNDVGGVLVVDDYAHHPTEITHTLRALRNGWLPFWAKKLKLDTLGRLIVLFEPHRYSRTKELFTEFLTVFADADQVLIGEIYAAGEDEIPGISGQSLAQAVQHRDVRFAHSLEEAALELLSQLRTGDVVVFLGAGSISQVGHLLAESLRSCNEVRAHA